MFDRLATLLIRSSGRAGQPDTATLHFERLLPGSPEQLWPWLTVSDKRAQWLAAGDMPDATGDAFELHFDNTRLSPRRTLIPERFRRYDKVCTTAHRLTCREPPHRLGFTWGGEGEDASAVHIELSPAGDQTRLTLTHSRLVNGAERINVASGWHTHLAILADRLADRTPPPFWLLFEGLETDYAKRLKAADLDVGV
ncbi:ATPase [Azoarcus sp. TTM-91]|nr:ATPase [Azoarcus sp. TTM-91]